MPYKDKEKQRQASRRHYEANRQKIIVRANSRYRFARDEVRKMKEASPCTDCGKYFKFYQMQYDHINDDKVANVNKMIKSASFERVLEEIAKCELVCANCHAARTYLRHGEQNE